MITVSANVAPSKRKKVLSKENEIKVGSLLKQGGQPVVEVINICEHTHEAHNDIITLVAWNKGVFSIHRSVANMWRV